MRTQYPIPRIILLVGLLGLGLPSSPANAKDPPPEMLISHVRHPQIEQVKTLLSKAYNSLNINVQFLEVPQERERLLAASGDIDGVAVRLGSMASQLEGLIMVDAPLLRIKVHLICRKEIACSNDILMNPQHSVAIPFGSSIISRLLPEYRAKPLFLSYNQQIISMVEAGKLDYGFSAIVTTQPHEIGEVQIAQPAIHEEFAFHFINERYSWLLPSLRTAIRKVTDI